MSKVKQALLVVKIAIAIVAIVIGYIFYQNYLASQAKIEARKKADKLYNQDKWQESVDAYKVFLEKYPGKRNAVSSKMSAALQNMANEKSIKAMAIPKNQTGKKKSAYQEVVKLMEEAKEYDDLTEMSYIILCDSYIECGEVNKAKRVIAEAKSRNLAESRFGVQLKRIEQLGKKK